MAHDFLERLCCTGKICFQKKVGPTYEPYTEAIEAIDQADMLIVTWGNRASHTNDMVAPEAKN